MPITIIKNEGGTLSETPSAIPASSGWWQSIAVGDFDQDGDLDFMAGNLGLNSDLKASEKEPLCLYTHDFDQNGSLDPVLCHFVDGIEYPMPSRDELISQIPPIKVRFDTYHKYAKASFQDLFKAAEKRNMHSLEAQQLASCYVENIGRARFKLSPLPIEMQMAPLKACRVEDINQDGQLDVLWVGNDYATEVGVGRYDAFTGAWMLGQGNGTFTLYRGHEVGFNADKDARSLVKLSDANGNILFAVGNNSDSLQLFSYVPSSLDNQALVGTQTIP